LSATLAAILLTWRCRSLRTFFGLSDEYKEAIHEEFFQLKYYGSWSFFEVYNLPVVLRRWFLRRLSKQKEEEVKQHESALSRSKSGSR
tara:strand:+ start:70 stop:333 length:264 start_codon:yes stop_codon:yes gene_type:complete